MFRKIREWVVGYIAKKVVKLALDKADVKPYAKIAATSADKYLDKALGEKTSEEVQLLVVEWLEGVVKEFTTELREN